LARVFLSYSRKDAEFAGELHRRLRGDGVDCFFDSESIEGGEVWPESLGKAIEDCEIFVPILSPDFLASRWGMEECHLAMAKGRKIVPLLHRACNPEGFLQTRQYVDAQDYPKILRLLGGSPPVVTVPTDRSALPPVAPLPALHRMPYRSMDDRFVGRVDALWQLHDQLSRGRTSSIVQGVGVVFGTGGLGKTQLAVEYVYRFNPYYPGGIFWVEADQGLPRLIEVLTRAAKIEVDGRLKVREQVEAVWSALHRPAAMLVVLDNLPETEPLAPWLPAGGGIHVLVTTRRRDLSGYPHVSLQFLTVEEGMALLNSGDRQFGFEGRPLVEDVGGLPLALELSRGWLELRRDVDIAALRLKMRAAGEVDLLGQFAEAYGNELPTAHERNVAATFQLSWDLASEDGKDVLRVMSHLAPVPVPLRLLRAALAWSASEPITDRLGEAIAALWRLSLVERDEGHQPSAHRLILGFVRHLPDGDARWAEAVEAVGKEMNRVRDDSDTAVYQELEAVVPHAEAVLARTDLPDAREIEIAGNLGKYHWFLGSYRTARCLMRKALERATSLPAGDSRIARLQSRLALVLQNLGELPEARDLLRKALASDEQRCRSGDPSIARDQSNLASVLRELGELSEARDLLRKALASDEQSHPPGHPNIATRQSTLGTVLIDLRELAEARDLLREALASDVRRLPLDRSAVTRDQTNLALALHGLGELPEARDLLRTALASTERSLPPGHLKIAICQANLAEMLHDLGEFTEARVLMEKAHGAALDQFGPDDRRTKRRRGFLDKWSKEP
jgi:tetratricopeptide (TPR) repeat protein